MPKPYKRGFRGEQVMAVLFGLFLMGGLVACGGGDDDDDEGLAPGEQAAPVAQEVTVTGDDFKFDLAEADSLEAGLTTFSFQNEGKERHDMRLLKLNEGVEFSEFEDTLKTGSERELIDLQTFRGGSASIMPGASQTVTFNLEAGTYVAICFVEGHHRQGMYEDFEVAGARSQDAVPPDAEGQISLSDYEIILPEDFDGQGTYEFVNNGPQPHEAQIFKVEATLEQLEKFLNNPKGEPPFKTEDVGGVAAFESPGSGFAELDLEPGVYAMLCFVPDEKTGQPHFLEGMFTTFEL